MVYVHRTNGKITKTTGQPEESFEQLPDDDPEIIEFNSEPELTDGQIYDKTMKNNAIIKAMAIGLNKVGAFSSNGDILSDADLKVLIKSNM